MSTGYIDEPPTWRLRKRHRQQITLGLVLLLLLATGAVGYAVYSGAIGGPAQVDVAKLPPCPPAAKVLTPESVHVNVYNATRRDGLAAKTANALALRSFAIGTYANDPKNERVAGIAIIRYGPKGSAAATVLAKHVAGAKLVNDKRKGAGVDLVLGAKYKSLKPLAQVTATPTSTPTCRVVTPTPSVTTSPTATAKVTAKATTAK
ncbi:LytR C-terminal domain-containing protein [Angustibacter luteus]|uniref:LytR C-terminal domain-containing protein n=1 Tax=Angustibacter luteus TaxID=658456 RepID=A0ABW1JDL7_9ACTN